MKTLIFYGCLVWAFASCSASKQPNEVTMLDRPGQTELTESKHVKKRNAQENRDRVKYYNSLQHKNHYKPHY